MKINKNYIIVVAIVGLILLNTNKVNAEQLKKINVGSRTRKSITINNVNYKTNYHFLPIIPNQWTNITIDDTISAIKAKNININLARSIFAILVAEAARTKDRKSFLGLNNNYAGVQTDSGVWGNSNFIAQTARIDSGGDARMFAVFKDFNTFLDFLAERLKAKGFDKTDNANSWAETYIRTWWGRTPTPALIKSKGTIYTSAVNQFNK